MKPALRLDEIAPPLERIEIRIVKRRDFLAISGAAASTLALQPRPSISGTNSAVNPKQEGKSIREIKSVRIYPAIGLCRVGGSKKFFYAPEIPGMPPDDADFYKDGNSLIKKQVQRFRIYAFDKNDAVIGEITANEAQITWGVRLANTKASWYEFFNPLDNGTLAKPITGKRRNRQITGNDKRNDLLNVDAGLVEISGINTNESGQDSRYTCQGEFLKKLQVKLGELRTDSKGRLLVVPGEGRSVSPTNKGITSFADNDEWIDDWCDGPVFARVQLLSDQRILDAKSAWVACAGPDYAPEITPLVTMYDVIENLNYQQGWKKQDKKVSFRQDIYPILHRLDLKRWVSEETHHRPGWADIGPLNDESYIKKLATNNDSSRKERNLVFSKLRAPALKDSPRRNRNDGLIPGMLGDGVNYTDSPIYMFSVTQTQYAQLKKWADGDFVNDYTPISNEVIRSFDDIPLAQQPHALTRAALESCSGGAFHPGVELTYNLRHAGLYERAYDVASEPYRIAHGGRPTLIQDLGEELTAEVFYKGYQDVPSPVGRQMPGDLTRWMGIPWQCDVFSCQSVDSEQDFPTVVWWPAQVPIDVLTEKYYEMSMNQSLPKEQRRMFASQRKRWSRRVAGVGYHASQSYWDGIENMIALWQRMGIVVRRPHKSGDEGFGADISGDFFVETGRGIVDIPSPSDRNR